MAEKNPKLTQRGLAREIGLGVSTVQRLYNNDFARVDKATVESLCDYFGCGIEDLFILREKKS